MEIGNKILELRKQNDLSQEQLAERLGVARQTISKWELGETSPDLEQSKKLSKIFNVSLDDLTNNDIKNILINKTSNTEKMSKTIINILKIILLILIITVIVLVSSLFFKEYFSVSPVATGQSIECIINGNKYTYEALPIKKNRRLNQIKLVKRNKYFMDVTENYQEEWKNAAVSMRIINKNKKALRKIRNNYSVSNLYITNTGELHLMDFDELIKKNYISELDEPVKFIKRNIVTRVIKRKTKKLRKIKNLSKDEIYRKLYVKYAKKVKKGK